MLSLRLATSLFIHLLHYSVSQRFNELKGVAANSTSFERIGYQGENLLTFCGGNKTSHLYLLCNLTTVKLESRNYKVQKRKRVYNVKNYMNNTKKAIIVISSILAVK